MNIWVQPLTEGSMKLAREQMIYVACYVAAVLPVFHYITVISYSVHVTGNFINQ